MKKNGTLIGLFSGMFWGVDTVLIGLVLATPIFLSFGNNASLITAFIHDGFSFLFLMGLLIFRKSIKTFFKVLFSKSGLVIALAALLGGPIGMGGYILSINYLGPALSSSVSAIYPAIGAILSYFVLKEKLKFRSVVGMGVAIVAIVLMGFTAIEGIPNLFIGLLFGAVCVVGWGSEAVIISGALKEDVSSDIAFSIRQFVSFLTYTFVVMPLVGYDKLASLNVFEPSFMFILVAGIIGSISYLFYYKAISLVGASKAMGLNISYPAWAYLLQCLITSTFDIKTFVLVLCIIVGSIMSADDPTEIFFFMKKDKKIS